MYSRKYEPIKIKHNSIDIYVCSYMLFNYIYICHCYATVKMSFVWKKPISQFTQIQIV